MDNFTPPCEGMIKVEPGSALAAYRAASYSAGEAGTPSSNHGVIGSLGLVDFLSLTVPEREFAFDAGADGFSRAQVAHPNIEAPMVASNDLLKWVFPNGSLVADVFEKKGRLGYTQSADIFFPGADKPCGFAARGGNGSTVLVSVSGAGMPFVGDMRMVKLALDALNAKITRLDAAFDDLDGEWLDMAELVYEARLGYFARQGKPPAIRFIDDLGTRKGCSLYVGSKGRSELNVYDKGMQQGDEYSRWRRAEARVWATNRVIPTDGLLNPLGVIVAMFPAMAAWLPECSPTFAKTSRAAVKASVGEMTEWLTLAAGRSLGLLREAAMHSGITDSELMNLLVRQGIPSRFANVPEHVVHVRANEYLQGALNELEN